jgi:hypothetical protein
MAFVERVMHWGAWDTDAAPPALEPDARFLSAHGVYAAAILIAVGQFTAAQFKAAIGATPADATDIDALIATVPAAAAARAIRIHEIHAVFILAEDRATGYNTPALVRTKLGI